MVINNATPQIISPLNFKIIVFAFFFFVFFSLKKNVYEPSVNNTLIYQVTCGKHNKSVSALFGFVLL